MQPSDFHVAILGGGIGGLTSALSIAQHCPGIRISVYEQAPEYKEIGAGVGIGVNAAKILHRLGVGKEANKISGERNGIHRSHRRWDNGEEIVTIKAGFDEGEIGQLSVHRAELLDVLLQAVKARGIATLHTNKRGVKVTDAKNNKVTLFFADSTTTTVDLVIGADGIHSALRAQFVPVDHPRYSGRIAYRGLLPLPSQDWWPHSSYAISWLAPGKHFLVFPISQNRTLNVVAFVSKPAAELGDLEESWTSTSSREELAKEYADWEPTVTKIISQMTERVGKWRLNDRELLPQWTFLSGKVVLLGDGAHAMLPHQGSGAGHAIEDAYILGKSLQDFFRYSATDNPDSGDLQTWMQVYQSVRLPRAQKAQITSRQAGDVYEMEGPDFRGLDFEECLPVIREKLMGRMKWVWGADVDREYEVVAEGVRPVVVNGHGNNSTNGSNGEVVVNGGSTPNGVVNGRVELREEIST